METEGSLSLYYFKIFPLLFDLKFLHMIYQQRLGFVFKWFRTPQINFRDTMVRETQSLKTLAKWLSHFR